VPPARATIDASVLPDVRRGTSDFGRYVTPGPRKAASAHPVDSTNGRTSTISSGGLVRSPQPLGVRGANRISTRPLMSAICRSHRLQPDVRFQPWLPMTSQLSSYPHKRRVYVHEDQTEHRVRPRDLGRRLVLQQVDPCASGGGARGGVGPEQPRHAQRRRRGSHPSAWTGQQPGHPRRPLVGRNRHHSRGNRRTRCRAGLHRRSRPGRRRDDAEPAGPGSPPTSSPTSRS